MADVGANSITPTRITQSHEFSGLTAGPLQATLSKLLTYCVQVSRPLPFYLLMECHPTAPYADNDNGPFWLYDGPFWTIFCTTKIFWAVLVGAVLV